VSTHYSHLNQPLSGDISTPGNSSFDDERATTMSTSFDSAPSPQQPSSQFVPNSVGIGQRSVAKRSTFKRTNRVDASNDDLLHDPQQKQQQRFFEQNSEQDHDYNHSSSNPYAPQHIRHPSDLRQNTPSHMSGSNTNSSSHQHHLIHGAYDSPNSNSQYSGMILGGASFDPEQHHIRHLGNANYPAVSMRSPTPTVDLYDVPQTIPVPRRKSLPSIVNTLPGDYRIDETARSNVNLQGKETFIIENGIRKRVTEQAPSYTESGTVIPQATVMTSSTGSPTLARRVILESVTRVDAPTSTTSGTGGNKRTSMPTLVNVARQRQAAPSKFIE
jgi:hypothetical protein